MIYKGSRFEGANLLYDVANETHYVAPVDTNFDGSPQDLVYQFKEEDRLDLLANKFYGDPQKHWIILYANPEFMNELEISVGDILVIPHPDRVVK